MLLLCIFCRDIQTYYVYTIYAILYFDTILIHMIKIVMSDYLESPLTFICFYFLCKSPHIQCVNERRILIFLWLCKLCQHHCLMGMLPSIISVACPNAENVRSVIEPLTVKSARPVMRQS